jgi:hypothetical protein
MASNNQPGEDAVSNNTSDAGTDTQKALNDLTSTRVPALSARTAENIASGYEAVRHPAHYGGDTTYETIKVIQAWGLGFEIGTVIKHLSRAGKKPGADYIEDLEKAQFYLQAEIDRVKAIGR